MKKEAEMQKVDKTTENIKLCRCMTCPSYTEHCKLKNAPENFLKSLENLQNMQHYEKLYCAFEKSNCIYQDKGCVCSECDVYKNYNLQNHDYCLHNGGIM